MKRFLAILGLMPLVAICGLIVYRCIKDPFMLVVFAIVPLVFAVAGCFVFSLEWLMGDFKKRKTANKPLDE